MFACMNAMKLVLKAILLKYTWIWSSDELGNEFSEYQPNCTSTTEYQFTHTHSLYYTPFLSLAHTHTHTQSLLHTFKQCLSLSLSPMHSHARTHTLKQAGRQADRPPKGYWSVCGRLKLSGRWASYSCLALVLPMLCTLCTQERGERQIKKGNELFARAKLPQVWWSSSKSEWGGKNVTQLLIRN